MHPLRGSGTCGQDRLELRYAEKHLLEFSVSGPKRSDDVQFCPTGVVVGKHSPDRWLSSKATAVICFHGP